MIAGLVVFLIIIIVGAPFILASWITERLEEREK